MKGKGKLQKIEYLVNEKSFLGEIKAFFIVFEGLSFGKKIADTTFNILCLRYFTWLLLQDLWKHVLWAAKLKKKEGVEENYIQ